LHVALNGIWSFVSWSKFWNPKGTTFEEHQNMVDIHVITMQEIFCKVQTSSGEDGWRQ
jgi:hypothetical protein